MTSSDPEARRAARRQAWTGQVFRPGEEQAMADADLHFWLDVPVNERAALVWQLSVEAFRLAGVEADERRLLRSDYRLVRR